MTLEELQTALELIPEDGAINKARRREIIKKIMEILAEKK